jgi:hypothetical protein
MTSPNPNSLALQSPTCAFYGRFPEPLVNELAGKRIQELSKIEYFYLPTQVGHIKKEISDHKESQEHLELQKQEALDNKSQAEKEHQQALEELESNYWMQCQHLEEAMQLSLNALENDVNLIDEILKENQDDTTRRQD